jgi:hypothetical protein
VHLVGERDPQNVIVGRAEMGDIGFLSRPPIWLSFAFASVNWLSEQTATTRATRSPNRFLTSSSRALPP